MLQGRGCHMLRKQSFHMLRGHDYHILCPTFNKCSSFCDLIFFIPTFGDVAAGRRGARPLISARPFANTYFSPRPLATSRPAAGVPDL